MSDDIKTVLSCQGNEKPLQLEQITNPKQIIMTILSNLRSKFTFFPSKIAGADVDNKLEESGFLHRRFLLSHVREWLGLQQIDDPIILNSLDGIAKKGKAKFIRIEQTRDMNIHDMGFVVEVGRAIRSWRGQNAPNITAVKFYSARSMSEKEKKKPSTILNVRARVEKIREEQDRYRREKYGIFSKETEIEKEMRRIDRESDIELRHAILDIANSKKDE